jgi:hypothetical protein
MSNLGLQVCNLWPQMLNQINRQQLSCGIEDTCLGATCSWYWNTLSRELMCTLMTVYFYRLTCWICYWPLFAFSYYWCRAVSSLTEKLHIMQSYSSYGSPVLFSPSLVCSHDKFIAFHDISVTKALLLCVAGTIPAAAQLVSSSYHAAMSSPSFGRSASTATMLSPSFGHPAPHEDMKTRSSSSL